MAKTTEEIIRESQQAASFLPGGANAPGAGIQSGNVQVGGTERGAAQLSRVLTTPLGSSVIPADAATDTPPPTFEPIPPTDDTPAQQKQVESQRKALESAYQKELDRLTKERETAEAKQEEIRKNQEAVLGAGEGKGMLGRLLGTGQQEQDMEELTRPFREQTERSERARLKVEENFQANQALIGELEGLLTETSNLTKKLQEQRVPGLAGIQQSSRVMKNLETVSGRVAVIEAVMAARNNQIGVGLGFIDRTLGNIQQDRTDRLNYLNGLFNWYETQRTEEGEKIFNLSKEQKDIINRQIGLLENDLARTQQTADMVRDMMLDPETAGLLGEAGVSLTDSVGEANEKIRDAVYSREVRDVSNEMQGEGAESVLSPQGIPADRLFIFTDSRGKEHYYKLPEDTGEFELRTLGKALYRVNKQTGETELLAGTPGGGGSGGGLFSTGTQTERETMLKLRGVGISEQDLNLIDQDVAEFGLDEVLQNESLTDPQKNALRELYGQGEERSLSEEFLRQSAKFAEADEVESTMRGNFSKDELSKLAKEAGFGAWNKSGETEVKEYLESPKAREKYAELLVDIVEQYRQAGYSEEEILKMMQ